MPIHNFDCPGAFHNPTDSRPHQNTLITLRYSFGDSGHWIAIQAGSARFDVAIMALVSHSLTSKTALADMQICPASDYPCNAHRGTYAVHASPAIFQQFLDFVNTGRYPLFYKENKASTAVCTKSCTPSARCIS